MVVMFAGVTDAFFHGMLADPLSWLVLIVPIYLWIIKVLITKDDGEENEK